MSRELAAQASDCGEFSALISRCAGESGHSELAELLTKIALCESGNGCSGQVSSPSKKYHGAFQFAGATWRRRCIPMFRRQGLEECAKKEAVFDTCCATRCAAKIVAAGGVRSNWPACSRKILGPRKKRTAKQVR